MSLTSKFAGNFDDAIQQRGRTYFRDRRVTIDAASVSASGLTATVRGTSPYVVTLERAGQKLRASCPCPYFYDDWCKHIWAVLLAADAQGLFNELGHDSDIKLVREIASQPISSTKNVNPSPAENWRKQLSQLPPPTRTVRSSAADTWPSTRELLYVIDLGSARMGGVLHLDILFRDVKPDGFWSSAKSRHLPRDLLHALPDPNDRVILAALTGASSTYGEGVEHENTVHDLGGTMPFRFPLSDPHPELLPAIIKTGRCRLRIKTNDVESRWLSVTWEEAEAWQLRLELRRSANGKQYALAGALWRNGERMELTAPGALIEAGILFMRNRAARYEHHGAYNWISLLREHGSIVVPQNNGEEFLAELLRQPHLPPLDLPEELRYEELVQAPRPRLAIKPHKDRWKADQLQCELSFDYAGRIVAHGDTSRGLLQTTPRRVLFLRDLNTERAAAQRLHELDCQPPFGSNDHGKLELEADRLPHLVAELTAEGWHIEAEGKVYRSPGKFELQVSSGVDWFELHGEVNFGGAVAKLPELLSALRRGERMVRLDDGTMGLLPQEWLKRYGMLAGFGDAHEGHLRFTRSQVGLLDALLAAQPEVQYDAVFVQVRDGLRDFTGVEPVEAPAGFKGELRPYQKDALGWFDFLRRFGFGGCLADDMGLGKTVQVLALLEARRVLRAESRGAKRSAQKSRKKPDAEPSPPVAPSLAVVPRSLIFNWQAEAARFSPLLRVLDHTGNLRQKNCDHFNDYDLILTTYGTLRNDAAQFKDFKFDYVILDESQAIKNADSVSAKAVRLLKGNHRLALSGTPIENHLGELWSLFEFLNPGMLGAASIFKLAHGAARNPDEQTRKLLAQALRPFILRRTKEQVARDLPPKFEQTLYCDLDTRQRRLYDQLREHYRSTLLKRVDDTGVARAKIQILEALLRLRQAAIHPGLIDPNRTGESSAKLDMLLPQLLEVIEEGHKTLVFSQFTGMLSILRKHLDEEGVVYEYLDGKTRDRQACVERFQTDPQCKLFLISLKAGGVGLNLTAAQYVFLLDPWWNPAVEAQAIDRAHRIGQNNPVFAYRLIARNTVEEKVLELQSVKRDLADAIIGANEGLIRNLAREDLELLLS